jgi:serine protease Do
LPQSFNPEENKDFDKQSDTADSKVVRDALGISVIPLDAEIARALGLTTDIKGVVIDVPGTGTGAQVGLRRGDVIVSANYKPVSTAAGLAAVVKEAKAAGRGAILLGVKRRGAPTQYVTVRLEK